jgi:type IV pilus assembly protein PilB
MAVPEVAQLLVRRGVCSKDQMIEALRLQKSSGVELEDALDRLGYASANEVMQVIAEKHDLEFVDLSEVDIPSPVLDMVPESVARENTVIPMSQDNGSMKVIMSDPMDLETVDKLRFILNREIQIVLAPKDLIQDAINRHYGQNADSGEDDTMNRMMSEFTETGDIAFDEEAVAQSTKESDFGDEDDAPVIKLVNVIIAEAVQLDCSDIHIEPMEERVRIRYRVDGVLTERKSAPKNMLAPILSRIKIMSKMDISEKRRPQDGRIKIRVRGKELDLRVSVLPSNHGQAVVMRLLDPENIKVGVRQLGFSQSDFEVFEDIIRRPNGIFLVTGPTGSGKTTTLYSALGVLNRPDRKIITAEEPVEYYLPGINQVEVKHQIGLDFQRIIRAMLRQAPNVILVGEIRDQETADMAIQASLTGHLVFSTLHTNDAPGAITRLIDIGVQPFLVASSVMAILAQRLVRLVCPKCKQSYRPDPKLIKAANITSEELKNAEFARGKGCAHCRESGYKGRKGIFELLVMNGTMRDMAFRSEATQNIRKAAVEGGMVTLLKDGINKALMGITTLDEVLRTAHADVPDDDDEDEVPEEQQE